AAPIRVRWTNSRAVYRDLTSNDLSTGRPSVPSRIVLQRRGLMELFEKRPPDALAALHREVVAGTAGPDELFALSELSASYADRGGGRPSDAAAAGYAGAFLFPDGAARLPGEYDPRLRVAADLYNRAITAAFEPYGARNVTLTAGRYELPFGTMDVWLDHTDFRW